MKRGREKVKMLGEILEAVRGKVEREAEKDREGRKRIGRRLMMLWGFLGVWGVMALVLMVVRHWPGVGIDIREAKLLELGNRSWDPREEDLAVRKPNLTNEGTNVGGKASGLNAGDPAQTSEVERQDPILRLFDEL